MKFQHEWWRTLAGLVLIIAIGSAVVGCQEPATQPVKEPVTEQVTPVETPKVTAPSVAPEPANEPVINIPDPGVPAADGDWNCTPTGNKAIDEWKRITKCGGKLKGE